MNYEFHVFYEFNNEPLISLISLICYAQCSIVIMEITARIMIITAIRFPTNALSGLIISNLPRQITSNY